MVLYNYRDIELEFSRTGVYSDRGGRDVVQIGSDERQIVGRLVLSWKMVLVSMT